MKKLSLYTLLLLCCMLLGACSGSGKFKVDGTVEGNRTMNLRVVYPGDDNVNSVLIAAREGKFLFEGHAPEGALVEIYDNDYRLMGCFYAKDGDELKVRLTPSNPFAISVKGNEISERWCAWNKENMSVLRGHNAAAVNAAVAKYVKAHKADLLSALLIMSCYDAALDPAGASKLMASLDKAARPNSLIAMWQGAHARVNDHAVTAKVLPINYMDTRDSLRVFSVKGHRLSLLAFSSQKTGRKDSVLAPLKRLNGRVNMLDLSADEDTATWRRSYRSDSISWRSAWAAGSLCAPGIDRLGVPTVPYFIVADSTGRQLLRTPSVRRAEAFVDSILKK